MPSVYMFSGLGVKTLEFEFDGLALFAQDKEGLTAPFGLPDKESVIEMLNQLEEKELLKTRKKKIELVLNNINLLYEKDF